MKKKTFLIASIISLSALVVASVCFVSSNRAKYELTYGNNDPFVLNLNRSVTSSEISAGQASFNTSKGNPIVFKFDSSKASVDSGLVSLATGGYLYNETRITGITKVEALLTSGSATLSYGNAMEALNVGSASLSGTSLITVNLEEPCDFLRIDDVTGPLAISNLKISYDCSNDYQYAHDKEAASGDILYTASYSSSDFNINANYSIDRNCFDVANINSGFSYHITTSTAAAGWPTFILDLGHTVDMTNAELQISGKGINHTAFNYMLLDANTTNILNGNRSVTTLTDEWQTFNSGSFAGSVASGKSLTDVAKIRFSFNFSGDAGTVREIFLDELYILTPETVTRHNLENTFTKPNNTQTPTGSLCLETYGENSTVSRKLDYSTASGFPANNPTTTYRAYASFDIESGLGANNGVDFKNSTFSMDIKFSSSLVNAEDTRKNSFTLEFADGEGVTASIAVNVITFTMQEGWIHVSYDLSTVSGLSSLNGHAKNIRFGFYGVYAGNQDDAVIIIDNLAFYQNETLTRNNLEMCPNINTNSSRTAIGTPNFNDVAGSGSTASKKLTYAHASGFANAETGTYRAMAVFDIMTPFGANSGVNAKISTLSMDVKFSDEIVNSPDANKNRFSVEITDNQNATASTFYVNFTMAAGWNHISYDLSAVSGLAGLTDHVSKITFGFYGIYTGNQATAYILVDNLAMIPNETPSRSNLEMCPNINTNSGRTAVGEINFNDVAGSGSTASKKLTYAHASGFSASETGTYRAMATFDVATPLGASNGIDAKNCTLSMDIKFSDELVNSGDTRKNTFTLELADGSNHTKELAANNFTFTMSDGWIHFSKDLSTLASNLSDFDGNLTIIRFGFYGVYTGNQATAYIIIDNMAFTANS